ncbi:ParB-like nuclease domain protein [Arthrobacter phage Ottawa]|nr:ParB-like nuclease domain protein [Arthrobacter phage Kharcho]WIC89305.1 ParB-like nuclease domain protein [Arthrobacter phage Ottawa]
MSNHPIKDLRPYHKNPRRGNVKAIAAALEELGQYRPITVNKGTLTGRPNEILTGNHTCQAAKSLGWKDIAVAWVDVDDDTAARIVLADNRTSDLGTYDTDELAGLLGDLPDLTGTGYDEDDLNDMLIAVEEAAAPDVTTATEDPEEGGEEGGTRWEIASRKTIILGYPLDRFVWITAQFAALSKVYGTTSNANTLKRLLEDAK